MAAPSAALDERDARAIGNFQAYLRCKTVHPSPTVGYEDAAVLLQRYATDLGLEYRRLDLAVGHPVIVLKWLGSDVSLPSIVLSSHMDVVPVMAEHWTCDPWAADIIDGKIYGRGTQDMKSVGIQYMEAISRLIAGGFKPTRNVFVLWVPDEEVGGNRGMKLLLSHSIMREVNAGLILDEGLASPTDKFSVFYGERKIWWIRVRAVGPTGHGSRFIEDTAVPKLLKFANRLSAFREAQAAELQANCHCGKQLGDFTSINLTMLHAGDHTAYQYNVIPSVAEAGFDCRVPATVDLVAFKAQLDGWAAEDDVILEWVSGTGERALDHSASSISPDSYWWNVFSSACEASGAPLLEPSIFPAATDSRWVRLILGTPCFGFSPMRNCPILLHEHDEFIPVVNFLEGIRIYEALIPKLADAPPSPISPGDAAVSPAPL